MRKPDVDGRAVEALLRRVFGTALPVAFARTADGVSTQVYRILRGAEVSYLRVAEEADENLETDAELHRRLRGLGVRVADVVHVEVFDAGIGRSVMITTEVPGVPLAAVTEPGVAAAVVEEAGADLAVINQVPVRGFGFVRRHGRGWPLRAEHPRYDSFAGSRLPRPWPGPLAALFAAPELDMLEEFLEHERGRPPFGAVLAHGDFDVTPVFCAGGRYTGLIDFGEIRGADPLFDLGHFLLHDRETVDAALLPALIRGYQRVRRLPPDHPEAMRRSAVLLGLRQLCRWLGPPRHHRIDSAPVVARARRISALLTGPTVS